MEKSPDWRNRAPSLLS